MKNLFSMICILFLGTAVTLSQTTVKGVVKELKDGQELPLPFANVFLEGTTTGAQSDFDGNYTMIISDAGTYTLSASFVGLQKFSKTIIVKGNETITLDILLKADDKTLKELKVTGVANRENEQVLMLEQKKAQVIVESIGAKRLSDLGVSDAAAATSKITGVTKNEGSGDIYVRGLGDRYLSTTLNGLPVPSDNVNKKNIDLNLFSTDVIKSVGISKTYAVSGYGDQASGNVNVSSKTISEKFNIGLSAGSNTNVMSDGRFGDFKATQNYGDQTMGFYSAPYGTKEAMRSQSWNTRKNNLPIDGGVSVVAGKKFGEFSVFGTLSHSISSSYQTGKYQRFFDNQYKRRYEDATYYKNNFNTTGLINLGYNFGAGHNINFVTLASFKTTDELFEAGRDGNGWVLDQKPTEDYAFVRDQNIKETQVIINQILGKHEFSSRNNLNWAFGYSVVNAEEPNRIRNELVYVAEDSIRYPDEHAYQQKISLQEISDAELNGLIKDEFTLVDNDDTMLKLTAGVNFRNKKRDLIFNVVGLDTDPLLTSYDIDNLDATLLNSTYYDSGELSIKDYLSPEGYDAELQVYSGFMDWAFQYSKLSGSLGVRYEFDRIYVSWFSNFGDGNKENIYNNILPALNLKYELNEKSALRLAASKTVTLPEFKEIAPFNYMSPEGDFYLGNSELKMSQNYNFDLKWEMFPTRKDLISFTGFYKLIKDPINRTVAKGATQYFTYDNTGDQAQVYGLEFELRKSIIKAESTTDPSLDLTFNATKMWFEQDLLAKAQYNGRTTSGLEGAPEYITNFSLSYNNNKPKAFGATLTGNYSSDKIYSMGFSTDTQTSGSTSSNTYTDEIIQKGFVTLDLVLTQKLSDRVSLKLTGKNLLDPKIEQTQNVEWSDPTKGITNETVRSYKKGIAVKVGVSININ